MPIKQLNYHHLYYFWQVAKTGHLTQCAERLHIAQSALSAQIKQLEDEVGQMLFLRHNRKLTLTDAGHQVLRYAEAIFNLGNQLLNDLNQGIGSHNKIIRIGAVATLSRNFQENFIRPIFKEPDVHLVLESASLTELLERLKLHHLDLILSNKPIALDHESHWRCRLIAKQSVSLVGPPRHTNKAFKFPQDCQQLHLLLPGISSDIRSQFDVLCESLNFHLLHYSEVDDMAMLRLLARDQAGVALVPEVVVQDELQYKTLEKYCTLPDVTENFYAISLNKAFPSEIFNKLLAEN
ncbi:MAG TPA: LysR family transcriptional regulator [Ferrovaceae bacterium]|jgi:LysR family transcriptional activator of nhaA|nr:LysR family transcriptional regulator [Ferrovaceae bacterium]HQU07200.1 LysR family transcriptional regulator [Ferrovaceae bacterium]